MKQQNPQHHAPSLANLKYKINITFDLVEIKGHHNFSVMVCNGSLLKGVGEWAGYVSNNNLIY